jgi:hypothetical protein
MSIPPQCLLTTSTDGRAPRSKRLTAESVEQFGPHFRCIDRSAR